VGIVLGSDSDLEVMLEAVKVLDALEVGHEVVVASARRTPVLIVNPTADGQRAGPGIHPLLGQAGDVLPALLREAWPE